MGDQLPELPGAPIFYPQVKAGQHSEQRQVLELQTEDVPHQSACSSYQRVCFGRKVAFHSGIIINQSALLSIVLSTFQPTKRFYSGRHSDKYGRIVFSYFTPEWTLPSFLNENIDEQYFPYLSSLQSMALYLL